MLPWDTFNGISSILCPWRPAFSLRKHIFTFFFHHHLAEKLYFVFAAFRPSFSSLPKRYGFRTLFNFNRVAEIFDFVFATFGSSLTSFHGATETHFHLDGRSLLELKCFFDDSFFVFGALRPASAPMLIVIIVRGVFVVVLYLMVVSMSMLVIALRILNFHFIRVILLIILIILLII